MITAPKLSIKSLKLTTHSWERLQERFKQTDKQVGLTFVKNLLGRSKYIGEVSSDDGGRSYMYTVDKIAVHVSVDLAVITTIYEIDTHGQYHGLKNKIVGLYEKEFRKTDRNEKALLRRLEHLKIKNDAEVAALKYRKYKTRSINVKEECEQAIVKLHNEINGLELKIKHTQMSKRDIARAFATVVL